MRKLENLKGSFFEFISLIALFAAVILTVQVINLKTFKRNVVNSISSNF